MHNKPTIPHGGMSEETQNQFIFMKSINSIAGTALNSFQMRNTIGGETDRPKICSGCSLEGASSASCAKDAMGNCSCYGDNSSGQTVAGTCSLVKPPRR